MLKQISNVLPELTNLYEVSTRQRMLVVTRPMEKRMAREVAKWFLDMGDKMVKALRGLSERFDQNAELVANPPTVEALRESLSHADWTYLINNVMHGTRSPLEDIIDVYTGTALMKGAETLLSDFDTRAAVRFTLSDPRAIAWAEGRAAAQVTRINETTRERMNTLLTNAVRDGKGWKKTAKEIEAMFEDFAGPPLFPSKKFTSRSQAVAAYEIGDSYEAGQWMAADSLEGAGWKMQKKWLNAGDSSVRPAHRANARDEWIAKGKEFSGDGAVRPPTDPGCRCTLLWRKDPVQEELDIIRRGSFDPFANIRPPEGRAPRGMGPEYAQRRRIVSRIKTQMKWRSQAEAQLRQYRGQTSHRIRWRVDVQKQRVRDLDKGIAAALDIANDPLTDDWEFKSELIDGIFGHLSALRQMSL